MLKNKKKKKAPKVFSTENWNSWTNTERYLWLRNFRDRLRENNNAMAKKYELTEAQLKAMDEDVLEMERLAAQDAVRNN